MRQEKNEKKNDSAYLFHDKKHPVPQTSVNDPAAVEPHFLILFKRSMAKVIFFSVIILSALLQLAGSYEKLLVVTKIKPRTYHELTLPTTRPPPGPSVVGYYITL